MNHNSGHRRRRLALIAGSLVALAAEPALAQDALGDGSALDNNLQSDGARRNAPNRAAGNALDNSLEVGSGGFNRPTRSFRQEVALRNAIVTGNAPGGLSFRGDVGYRAANDFRSEFSIDGTSGLGSEDLFAFERDAFSSALATRNVRGIYGIQQQFQHAVSGQIDDGYGGALIVNRPGAHSSSNLIAPVGAAAPSASDVFGDIRGTLRSTSEATLRTATRPEILGQYDRTDSDGLMYMSGSPLQGVRALPAENAAFDAGREVEPFVLPMMRPDDEEETPNPNRIDGRVRPESASMHATVLESVRVTLDSNEELARRILTERKAAADAAAEEDAETPESPTLDTQPERIEPSPDEVAAALDRIRRELLGQPALEDPDAELSEWEQLARDAAELTRNAATITELNPDLRGDAVYRRHVARGVEALTNGQWFDAEERFTAAVNLRPGDATAAVGRIHAQIGAGMFLSGAVNLRRLFEAYPEMIGVRYGENLLPSGDRLIRVRELLRTRAADENESANDAALLLAYIGFQYENADDLEFGFERLDATRDALGIEDDRLDTLLRNAWRP